MRTARALLFIVACLASVSVVPAAKAGEGHHLPTILRAGDDRRKDGRELQKAQNRPRPTAAAQAQVSKVLAERRALAPVIAALDVAFRRLPADSDWRSTVLRIRDCMELGVEALPPHLELAEGPAQQE